VARARRIPSNVNCRGEAEPCCDPIATTSCVLPAALKVLGWHDRLVAVFHVDVAQASTDSTEAVGLVLMEPKFSPLMYTTPPLVCGRLTNATGATPTDNALELATGAVHMHSDCPCHLVRHSALRTQARRHASACAPSKLNDPGPVPTFALTVATGRVVPPP
jgi:hypothetical protein